MSPVSTPAYLPAAVSHIRAALSLQAVQVAQLVAHARQIDHVFYAMWQEQHLFDSHPVLESHQRDPSLFEAHNRNVSLFHHCLRGWYDGTYFGSRPRSDGVYLSPNWDRVIARATHEATGPIFATAFVPYTVGAHEIHEGAVDLDRLLP